MYIYIYSIYIYVLHILQLFLKAICQQLQSVRDPLHRCFLSMQNQGDPQQIHIFDCRCDTPNLKQLFNPMTDPNGAGILMLTAANIKGENIDGIHVTIYSSTMDPSWEWLK